MLRGSGVYECHCRPWAESNTDAVPTALPLVKMMSRPADFSSRTHASLDLAQLGLNVFMGEVVGAVGLELSAAVGERLLQRILGGGVQHLLLDRDLLWHP